MTTDTDLSDDDLVRLKELAGKATAGDWQSSDTLVGIMMPGERYRHVCTATESPDDAAFIAAAKPKTLLSLLSRLELAESRLAEVTEALRAVMENIDARPDMRAMLGPFEHSNLARARAALSSTPATPPSRAGEDEVDAVWQEVVEACSGAWPDRKNIFYSDSPIELIIEIINELDEARAALAAMPRTQEK